MISTRHRCLFIHIPKTAGTSIETVLGYHEVSQKRGRQDHRRIRNFQQAIWPPARGRTSIGDFARFANQRIKGRAHGFGFVSQAEYDDYFKFAIVRNPWDRAFSWYRNVIRDPIHQKELSVSASCKFDDFVAEHLDNWALAPQMDWIVDERGEVGVDYIGRFEDLERSFNEIRRKLQLEETNLPNALSSGGTNYRSAYSDKSRETIAKKYADEIKFFDYAFD